MELRIVDQRVLPIRGLILTHNRKGQRFALTDLDRWLRLNRDVYKAAKVDVLVARADENPLSELMKRAAELDVKVSLRTDASEPPSAFGDLDALGLLDVFLTPASLDAIHLPAWFEACRAASLPVRVQVQAPFGAGFDAERAADRLAQAGAVAVNVTIWDPFVPATPCRDAAESRRAVGDMNAFVSALAARDLEANLLHVPFCHVPVGLYARVANTSQFFQDHQQYNVLAYNFAVKASTRSPNAVGKAILIPLGKNSSTNWYIDSKLLPWILEGAGRHFRLLVWRKLTRSLRIVRDRPALLERSEQAHEREIARIRAKEAKRLGPQCSKCRFHKICDHDSEAFKRALPGLTLTPQVGDVVMVPMHFAKSQPKYYDSIDGPRAGFSETYLALAEYARNIVQNSTPTREVDSFDYSIEGQWTHQMPGGVRWYSFTNSEKLSTVLARLTPPFTIALTLGGGIAECAGFSFGRHCKLVVPMESYSHQIVLHVNPEGFFVMLRDGLPVAPVEFESAQHVPARLAGVLEPRLSLWNIDGAIVTQTVLLWEGAPDALAELARIKYSVIVVCTRYARRLEMALLCLAHQRGFDLDTLEVIVSYVPGIDPTDDVIDSMKLAHPKLRIVRAPFTEGQTKSKGVLINEALRVASGEWIVLLDADILVAADLFAKMDEVSDAAHFMCPDGRQMLTPEETAKVLLGELRPWEDWDALRHGQGEFRYREANGVPIGFFQCVRKECMAKIPYLEMDHFEGADWMFGYTIRKEFGLETRLTDTAVLHLDHGGSQWYGTQKQR